MSLTQELQGFRQQFLSSQSSETIDVMSQATADLENSGIANRSLKVGDKAPNFTLPNALEKTVELGSLLNQGALVISFYRGGWCPYCNLELIWY